MNKGPSEHWKKAIVALRADLVTDRGCRMLRDWIRDANGDITGWENERIVIRADMIDCDLSITVDHATDGRGFDGLSAHTFEGLNWGDEGPQGDPLAFFTNGRALRLISMKEKPITDPAERTARELTLARMRPAALPQDAVGALAEARRMRESRRKKNIANGQGGGRPLKCDPADLRKAVDQVRERMAKKRELEKTNPVKARHITRKAACEYAVKKYALDIDWQALQRHVIAAEAKSK